MGRWALLVLSHILGTVGAMVVPEDATFLSFLFQKSTEIQHHVHNVFASVWIFSGKAQTGPSPPPQESFSL